MFFSQFLFSQSLTIIEVNETIRPCAGLCSLMSEHKEQGVLQAKASLSVLAS